MTTDAKIEIFCKLHPQVATNLRCTVCAHPICYRCAHHNSVGYICTDCKEHRLNKFYSATLTDYLLSGLFVWISSVILGAIVVSLASLLPFIFFFIVFHSGKFTGKKIGRVAFQLIQGRRGKNLHYWVGASMLVGILIPAIVGGLILNSLWVLVLTGLFSYAAYQELVWQTK